MSRGRSAPAPDADRGGARRLPAGRPWHERLDDPDEPLYTMAVAADLLGLDVQALRRLAAAADHDSPRPSGNQRRYSRNDLAVLARAGELSAEGHASSAIARILELERHVDHLSAQLDASAGDRRDGQAPT